MYSCDVTRFSSETQNISNQGKLRGLSISGHGLSAQPHLKQPCEWSTFSVFTLKGKLRALLANISLTRKKFGKDIHSGKFWQRRH